MSKFIGLLVAGGLMDWQNSFFEIPLLITTFIAFYTAAQLRNYRKIKILSVVSFLLISVGFWSLFYALEIWTAYLPLQMLFAKLEYMGICAIPPLWISFSLNFSFPKLVFKPKLIFGYYLPFIVTLAVVFTNDLHHWFWKESTQIIYKESYLLSNSYGFWFWIHTLLSYLLIIGGSFLVIWTLVKKKHLSLPVFLILLGVLIPILGSLLFVLKIHIPFDLTPFTVTVSGVLLAASMIRFNLFNIKPIARSTLFASLVDPVFFVNNKHIIIEANQSAERLFEISQGSYLNDTIEVVLEKKIGKFPELKPNESFDIELKSGENLVDYHILTTIVQQKDKVEGYLITLRDVTAEKQIEFERSEETAFASFMNEVIELSVNSSNIDQLLNQVMQKIALFLNAGYIFIAKDSGINSRIISIPEKSEFGLIENGLNRLSQVIEDALSHKKTQIYESSESITPICDENCKITGLLAYPLFANNMPYGVLIVAFNKGKFPGERRYAFIEYSITQVMLSVSRLQLLEGLEKSIVKRTAEVVKLNTDLGKNLGFLNRLVDTSPNVIFSLNTNDEITFCNDQFIYEFGKTEKKGVIGKPLRSLFKGRDQGFCSTLLEISHNGVRSGQYECTLNLNLGVQKYYLVNKSYLLSPENQPLESIFILINLTKLKGQEIKLRNNENRLLTLFEYMPVVLFEEDQSELKSYLDKLLEKYGDGAIRYLNTHQEIFDIVAKMIKITDCNQMALDFYGFSTKEELFQNYPKLFTKSASESFKKQIEAYLQGKTEFESEDPHLRSNGEQVYVKVHLMIPSENVKDFRRVLVSVMDITKRKRAEIALSHSEEKFRSIIQQSVDGIILFDKDGKIIEWNNADERITGFSFSDVKEMYIWDLILLLTRYSFETEFVEIKDELHSALFDRTSPLINQIIELTLTTKNDDRIFVAAILSGIEIDQGFVGSIIIRDVSGFKKSQADIQRLASAVREISEGLIIANDHGLTEYVNLAVEQITGYSEEELVGKNLLRFLPTEFSSEQTGHINQNLDTGLVSRGKVISKKKDGTAYTLQYNIAPLTDAQGNKSYISVISDISQIELQEQQNRQAQKLEAIGSLAAGVAHEINTPTQYVGNNLLFIKKEFESIVSLLQKNQTILNRIKAGESLGNSIEEFLQEEKDADLEYLEQEIPKAIDESLEGIGRVTKIVQAIKEFSHPNMDEKTPLDLNRAIDTTITVSRNEWKYVADLVPHYDESMPTVMCSPGEINQVILNLITNASHAIKDQIDRGVYTRGLIEISTFSRENFIEIHVRDNGGGIPVEYREKVFNPFFTTKPVGMGTGQGLSIAHKVIVNNHNGSLIFDTEIGAGTTFKITLPLDGGVKPD